MTVLEFFRFADASLSLADLLTGTTLTSSTSLDFTGDGTVDQTDSLLIMRQLMGTFPGDSLTQGIPNLPSTASPDALRQKMKPLLSEPSALSAGERRMDIDGDGFIHPFSDGLLVSHHIHGQGLREGGLTQVPGFIKNPMRGIDEMNDHLKVLVGF